MQRSIDRTIGRRSSRLIVHRSWIATTSRTISYDGSYHRYCPIVRDSVTTHYDRDRGSFAPWPNRNQSYDLLNRTIRCDCGFTKTRLVDTDQTTTRHTVVPRKSHPSHQLVVGCRGWDRIDRRRPINLWCRRQDNIDGSRPNHNACGRLTAISQCRSHPIHQVTIGHRRVRQRYMPPIYLSVCGWTFVEESQQAFVDHHKEIRHSRVPICRNLSNGDGSSRMTAPAADGLI